MPRKICKALNFFRFNINVAGLFVVAGLVFLPPLVHAATTNIFNFGNTTVTAGNGPVNPVGGVIAISGTSLNAGDVVVFDGIIINNNPANDDAWGAVSFNGSGTGGATAATLGVLVRDGQGSGNYCQMWTNSVGLGNIGSTPGIISNRCRVELTCTQTGSTMNMSYVVKIDQGITGTFNIIKSGGGLNFPNNLVPLTFGAWTQSQTFIQTQPVIAVSATTPAAATVAAGIKATFAVTLTQGYPPKTSQQWLSNGIPIAGATSLTYNTPATTAAYNGTKYNIIVTNLLTAGNVVTSAVATLSVRSTPGLVPFIFNATAIPSTSQINPLNPPVAIGGSSLLAGDTVVFDGIVATNGPLTGSGDGWCAINLNAGGNPEGVTGATLGVLTRLGAGASRIYTNGVTLSANNPTSSGALTNRVHIELYPSATGSTTNMGWMVAIDQNLTGSFLPAITGTNLTFTNNTIPLGFGAYSVAGMITPVPVGLQSISQQLYSTNQIIGGFDQVVVTGNYLNVSNVVLSPTTPGLAYVSSNPNIVTVSSSGFLQAVGAGQATVTSALSGFSASNVVLVIDPGTLLSLSLVVSNQMPLYANQPASVLGTFDNVSNVNMLKYGQTLFVHNNPNIITVSASGLVTAVAPGATILSAVNGGVSSIAQTISVTYPTNRFIFDSFGDGFWTIVNQGNSKPLVINSGGASQATSTNTAFDQQFELLYNYQNSTFRIRNRTTWQCFGAKFANLVGSSVLPVAYTGIASQQWYLVDVGNGLFRVVNSQSGLVLQTDNGNPASVTLTNASANPFQYWSFAYQDHYPKKGFTGGEANYSPYELNWAYNYNDYTTATLPPSVNFVPMIYTAQYWEPLSDAQTRVAGWLTNTQPAYLLAYNEPDNTGANGGSNTSTNDVIALWPQIQALNVPLVSPACANTFNSWMYNFYSLIASNNYRVDYTAVHEYVPPNASSLISVLQSAYNTWGRPVWLTEFSPVDWNNTKSWSENDDYNFLAEFMWQAEGQDWLKRYAVFPFTGTNSASPWVDNGYTGTMFLDTNQTLSPYGELYATWDADLTLHARTPYLIHNLGTSFRLTATNNVTTPSASTIYVRNAATEWGLLPATTTNHWYIISLNDGRRLRNNNGTLDLAPFGTTGTNVDWWFNGPDGSGYYYLDNLARSQSLRATGTAPAIAIGLVNDPAPSSATQWRLVKPYQPVAIAAAMPPLVAISYTNQGATLTWSGHGTYYNIYRGTTSGGPYTKVVNLTASSTYSDSALQNGAAYYYVVTALNILGEESGYSTEVVAHPAATTVLPVGFAMLNNGLEFNWPADHTGWRLMMNTNGLANVGAWFAVPNSICTNQLWLPFDPTQNNVFFRLVYP